MTEIDLATLIKLYCNHRPVFGLPLYKVYDAFHTLAGADGNAQIDRGLLHPEYQLEFFPTFAFHSLLIFKTHA